MADTYVCKRCGAMGTKKEIPYKIIDNRDDRIVFKGQICDKCFDEFFKWPQNTESKNEQSNK